MRRNWLRRLSWGLVAALMLAALAGTGLYLYDSSDDRLGIVAGFTKLRQGMTEDEVAQALGARPIPWAEKFVYGNESMLMRRAYQEKRNGIIWFVVQAKRVQVTYIDGKAASWKFD